MDIDPGDNENNQDNSISAPPITSQKMTARAKAKKLKIQRSTRVTSKQIDNISFTRKLMKERERALSHSENQEAKEALLSISNKDVALFFSNISGSNRLGSAGARQGYQGYQGFITPRPSASLTRLRP